MAQSETQVRQMPGFARAMMRFQAFLLKHNLLGPAGNELMVVTVKGRKTGKEYSTPIGYLRDGDAIYALSVRGGSNWYKNALANGEADLTIKGKRDHYRASAVEDPAEVARLFELYQRERARGFKLLFDVRADAPEKDLLAARDSRKYIRFEHID